MKFKSEVQLETLNNATVDTDKFLVSDSSTVKYRTGAQLLSDLGVTGTYVPYTGATGNVDLGTHTLSSYNLIVNHTSGSGVAASITKGGSGEALTINKTSGSGNAMSVSGGLTSLVDLTLSSIANATIDTDKFIVSDSGAIKYRTGAQVLSDIGGQAALTNPITGTGTLNYVSKFTGATSLGNSQIFDNGTNVGIGTAAPSALGANIRTLDIKGSSGGGIRSGVTGGSESTFYTIAAGSYLGTISNIPLNFQTNNSVKATILANGNVGIGTTSPTFVTTGTTVLDVNGSTGAAIYLRANIAQGSYLRQTSNNLIIGNNTYGDIIYNTGFTEAMRITADRLVGIGTTAPAEKLDVYGVIRGVYTADPGAGAVTGKFLAYSPSAYGLVFRGYNTGAHSIQVQREANNAELYSLSLQPNGGNVGIGTISPTKRLDVVSSTNDSFDAIVVRPNNQTQTLNIGWQGIATSLNFIVSTNGSEKMRVTTAGNIGVGTASPHASAILHLRSTTQGFLPPVMRTGDRNGISSPAIGLMIFNETEDAVQVYTGDGWRTLAWA